MKYFLYIAGAGLAAFGLVDILHALDLMGVPKAASRTPLPS